MAVCVCTFKVHTCYSGVSVTSRLILTFDPMIQRGILLHTAAAHWKFSLLELIFTNPGDICVCGALRPL